MIDGLLSEPFEVMHRLFFYPGVLGRLPGLLGPVYQDYSDSSKPSWLSPALIQRLRLIKAALCSFSSVYFQFALDKKLLKQLIGHS